MQGGFSGWLYVRYSMTRVVIAKILTPMREYILITPQRVNRRDLIGRLGFSRNIKHVIVKTDPSYVGIYESNCLRFQELTHQPIYVTEI